MQQIHKAVMIFMGYFYIILFSVGYWEAWDHRERVPREDRGTEQDRDGHDQQQAEAPDGGPGGNIKKK